jgi:integrase
MADGGCGMSQLHEKITDYLTVRRAMGYKLERAQRLLPQFVDYLDQIGAGRITIEHAVTWATLPGPGREAWWTERLSTVRRFAIWLHAFDPSTQIPPTGLLPNPSHRAVPFLFSDVDIARMLQAGDGIRSPLRRATIRTLVGLLAVTGMRIGEALRLDRDDIDWRAGLLVVRQTKFRKSREIVLHPTTVAALRDYLRHRDRYRPHPDTAAVFITTRGTRLGYRYTAKTFRHLAAQAGLARRSPSCRPRPHDLRHSFAVNTLLDAYRTGGDVHTTVPLLSTYLGHVDPANTYWYLSAAPELLALAAQRLDDHLAGRP